METSALVITIVILDYIGSSLENTWSDVSYQAVSVADAYGGATTIIPLNDLTQTINVSVDMDLLSINNFDEASGHIDISGYLSIKWTEMVYTTAYGAAAPDTSALVLANTLWVPSLVLTNSVDDVSVIGDASSKVRIYFKTGECLWEQRVIVKALCTANVLYYPFDKQECVLKFSTWTYTSNELLLSVTSSTVGTQFYSENVEWTLKKTDAKSTILKSKSYVEFVFSIERKSMYFMISLLIPLIVLSILNIFVFLLPAESGERVGFAVTCFLAFVVFLGTITSSLPKSSSPLSMLSYYTAIMMVFSAATNVVVMITLRIYHKPENEPVPNWLKMLGNCLRCASRKPIVSPSINESELSLVEDIAQQKAVYNVKKIRMLSDRDEETSQGQVTWNSIGRVLDKLSFIAFLAAEIVFSVSYLLPVVLNAK
ncbi:hypothetical protein CHS0354_028134 [Potamilus streckersoni]|uniref:Uncharacterized protein n=1 Tax=Potamilus streckersoni TaxID=2493646 RepID=A0AAE0TI30_9BIVA|nr:hypothetical protein CHS0354_028134 [Potamilus streckersoni]